MEKRCRYVVPARTVTKKPEGSGFFQMHTRSKIPCSNHVTIIIITAVLSSAPSRWSTQEHSKPNLGETTLMLPHQITIEQCTMALLWLKHLSGIGWLSTYYKHSLVCLCCCYISTPFHHSQVARMHGRITAIKQVFWDTEKHKYTTSWCKCFSVLSANPDIFNQYTWPMNTRLATMNRNNFDSNYKTVYEAEAIVTTC